VAAENRSEKGNAAAAATRQQLIGVQDTEMKWAFREEGGDAVTKSGEGLAAAIKARNDDETCKREEARTESGSGRGGNSSGGCSPARADRT